MYAGRAVLYEYFGTTPKLMTEATKTPIGWMEDGKGGEKEAAVLRGKTKRVFSNRLGRRGADGFHRRWDELDSDGGIDENVSADSKVAARRGAGA